MSFFQPEATNKVMPQFRAARQGGLVERGRSTYALFLVYSYVLYFAACESF